MSAPPYGVTVPSLAGWQFQFQGLTFGHDTPVKIAQVQGLGGMAPVRSGDISYPRRHGQLSGLDVLDGRDFTIDVEIEQTITTPLPQAIGSVSTMMVPTGTVENPLWFQLPGYPLLAVMCRPRKWTPPWDQPFAVGVLSKATLSFHATDPRVYGVPQTASVTYGTSTGSSTFSFPVSFPVGFGSVSNNAVNCANVGNLDTYPIIIATGPITNPTFQNRTAVGSPTVSLTGTVSSGDQLVIDTSTHSLLYYTGGITSGTTPSQVGTWVDAGSVWWSLPANTISSVGLTESSGSGGVMTVQWSSAWQV